MSNTYFQFKKFLIQQEHCAMKVCTDACIQGADAARFIKNEIRRTDKDELKILDLGTGTGLLALMIAQEINDSLIDAVELDKNACKQAENNFVSSPWPDRLKIFHKDIRDFHSQYQYDFIICNPPFYENDLKSFYPLKNQAMHSTMLCHQELLQAVPQYLSTEGIFCVMLPIKQSALFREIAEKWNFYPKRILSIRHSPAHADFRNIIYLKKGKQDLKKERLCIRDENGEYTESFETLLKKYYLNI